MPANPAGRRGWQHLVVAASLVGLTLMRVSAPRSCAATITVTSTADELCDDGQCTLREAIANADANNQSGSTDCGAGMGNDTITFNVSGTITLESELTIRDAAGLTIVGPASGITISGNSAVRVFAVESGAKLTLDNLTAAYGSTADGGGVASSGTLTVTNCILLHNTSSGTYASSGGGGIRNAGTLTVHASVLYGNSAAVGGGGISNWSRLTVTGSSFARNSASSGAGIINYGSRAIATISGSTFSGNGAAGGALDGGGIFNLDGTLLVTNSTFSGNSVTGSGGGIYNTGLLNVANSTFSGNGASGHGGAIRNASPGSATLRNSIVANSATGGNCQGIIGNGGNNIDSGTSCGWGSSDGSISGRDPRLGSLTENGGPTQTIALLASSPAIDAVAYNAPNGCPTTDQRGYRRPVDGDDDGSALCDVGAFELGSRPKSLTYLPLALRGP